MTTKKQITKESILTENIKGKPLRELESGVLAAMQQFAKHSVDQELSKTVVVADAEPMDILELIQLLNRKKWLSDICGVESQSSINLRLSLGKLNESDFKVFKEGLLKLYNIIGASLKA